MGVEAILFTIKEHHSNSAAESIEYYLQLAESLFKGKTLKSNPLRYWNIMAELTSLSDNKKELIRSSLAWNSVHYRNMDDVSGAEYWSRIADFFERKFIPKEARQQPLLYPIQNQQGLKLIVGNRPYI